MKNYLLLFLLAAPILLGGCWPSNDSASTITRSRPTLGQATAPILIEEFSDLQCPACRGISGQVEEVVRNNPGLAKMHYYHFPLPQHKYAFIAAEASECAADQDKFWEYIDLVFEKQSDLNEELLYTIAQDLNLDQTSFQNCLANHEKKDYVTSDLKLGRAKGVNATPTLYVNGEKAQFSDPDSFEAYLKSL